MLFHITGNNAHTTPPASSYWNGVSPGYGQANGQGLQPQGYAQANGYHDQVKYQLKYHLKLQ